MVFIIYDYLVKYAAFVQQKSYNVKPVWSYSSLVPEKEEKGVEQMYS